MRRLAERLLLGVVFLLPWQTAWIYGQAFVAGEPFSFGVMNLYVVEGLILLTVTLILLFGDRDKSPEGTNVWRWMLSFLTFAALSSLWSQNASLVISQLVHLLSASALFWILLCSRVKTRLVVWAFVLGLMIPTLLGVWQVVVGSSPAMTILGLAPRDAQTLGDAVLMVGGERILRAYGSFPHPNIFGGYLAMGLVGIGWLWRAAKYRERQWLSVVGLILFVGLVLTFSRSAWLGLIVVSMMLLARRQVNIPTSLRGWLAWVRGAKLGSALIILVVALLSPLIMSRFSADASIESRSLTQRVEQYDEFGGVFEDHVFVGAGLHNYPLALEQVDPGRAWWEYQPVHNVWLLVLSELGILGLLIGLRSLWSVIRSNTKRPIGHFVLGGLFVLAPLFTISLFDHYLWTFWPGLALFAISLAMTYRIHNTYETKNP